MTTLVISVLVAVTSENTGYNTQHSCEDMSTALRRSFALRGGQWETADPFYFCAHHDDTYPKGDGKGGIKDVSLLKGRNMGSDFSGKNGWSMYHGEEDNIPGFPRHPHYGFETVTITRGEGLIDHADSLGSCGRFGNGDVQWMTAGNGVQHSEMFPVLNTDKNNSCKIFQVWLNLPKKSKRVDPYYTMLWHEDLKESRPSEGVVETIIADSSTSLTTAPPPDSWAADPKNMVAIHLIKMNSRSTHVFKPFSKGVSNAGDVSRIVYFYKGSSVSVGSGDVFEQYTAFDVDGTKQFEVTAGDEPVELLMLQGRKIGEPAYHHGPFLGNTREDIADAMQRFRNTEYGGWPWPTAGPVHDLSKGRFAKFVDGTVVEKK